MDCDGLGCLAGYARPVTEGGIGPDMDGGYVRRRDIMTATQNNSRPLNGRRSQMTMGTRGREEREGRGGGWHHRTGRYLDRMNKLCAEVRHGVWIHPSQSMGAKEGSGRAGEGGDIGTGPVKSQKNSEMKNKNKAARMGQKRSKKALTNCDQSPKRRTYEGWCWWTVGPR